MTLLLVHLVALLRRPLVVVCRLLKGDVLRVLVVMDNVRMLVKLVVMMTGVSSCGGRGRS